MTGILNGCPQIGLRRLNGSILTVSTGIVNFYLPHLKSRYGQHCCLDLRRYTTNPHVQIGLLKIFEHLKEIDNYGVSTALLDSFENLWNGTHRPQHRLQQPSGRVIMANIFHGLGHVLDPMEFGCSKELSSLLSAFFTSHCDEIMRDRSLRWIQYVNTLHKANATMEPIYSRLLNHPQHVELALGRGLFVHEVIPEQLSRLLDQKFDRDYYRHHGTHQRVYVGEPMPPHHAVRGGRAPALGNGGEYDLRDIMGIFQQDPSRIEVLDGPYYSGWNPRLGIEGPRANRIPRGLLH